MQKPDLHPFACSSCLMMPCLRMAQNRESTQRLPKSRVPENCPLKARRSDEEGWVTLHLPWQGEAYRKLLDLLPQVGGSKSLGRRSEKGSGSSSGAGSKSESEAKDRSLEEEPAVLHSPQWQSQNANTSDFSAITSSPTVKHVWVSAQAEHLMPGDVITFHVYLKAQKGEQDALIDQVSGKLESTTEGDLARAKFFIADGHRGKPFDVKLDRLYFIAKHAPKKVEVRSADLKLETNGFALWLELDVDNPKAKDDVVVLLDAGHQEIKRFKVAEMKESQADRVRLVLGDLPRGEKITLIRDLGSDEEGGKEVLVEDLSPDEITEQFGEIA